MSRLKIVRRFDLRRPGYAIAQTRDGAYTVVGTETGAMVFDEKGTPQTILPKDSEAPVLVHRVVVAPDFSSVMIATRSGDLVRAVLTWDDLHHLPITEYRIYRCDGDLHTFAVSHDGAHILVGHLKGGLVMLTSEGDVLWRCGHDALNLQGQTWSVAYTASGTGLYVGSAGGRDCGLSLLDATTGIPVLKQALGFPVTSVRALPGDLGVVVATPVDVHTDRLLVYSPDLQTLRWEQRLPGPLTALAVDRAVPIIALSVGHEGRIKVLDADRGAVLAERTFNEIVNDISLVGGDLISVVTQHHHAVSLRYK